MTLSDVLHYIPSMLSIVSADFHLFDVKIAIQQAQHSEYSTAPARQWRFQSFRFILMFISFCLGNYGSMDRMGYGVEIHHMGSAIVRN